MRLICVGLGNPGSEYGQTRHNVGFWLADLLAEYHAAQFHKPFLKPYSACTINLPSENLLTIVKPLTYMNRSGEIFSSNPDFLPAEKTSVIVFCDQMDIPPGNLRLRARGGTAGHNGLKSVNFALEHNYFPLYIGVGRPSAGVGVIDHVLGVPDEAERELIAQSLKRAIDGIAIFIEKGPEAAMSLLNAAVVTE